MCISAANHINKAVLNLACFLTTKQLAKHDIVVCHAQPVILVGTKHAKLETISLHERS